MAANSAAVVIGKRGGEKVSQVFFGVCFGVSLEVSSKGVGRAARGFENCDCVDIVKYQNKIVIIEFLFTGNPQHLRP